MAPAPRTRVPKGEVVAEPPVPHPNKVEEGHQPETATPQRTQRAESEPMSSATSQLASSPKVATTFLMRRRSSGTGSVDRISGPVLLRGDDPDIRQHLKHLGPSNAANRPKQTRINTVKIKPGIPNTIPENGAVPKNDNVVSPASPALDGGVGEGLLENAGRGASDAVHSLAVGYGTMTSDTSRAWKASDSLDARYHDETPQSPKSRPAEQGSSSSPQPEPRPSSLHKTRSSSTIGSLHSVHSSPKPVVKKRTTARSGSITENLVDVNGVKKIILETTSSSDSDDKVVIETREPSKEEHKDEGHTETETEAKKGKKKRKKRAKKKNKKGESSKSGEDQPLLGGQS